MLPLLRSPVAPHDDGRWTPLKFFKLFLVIVATLYVGAVKKEVG